MSISLVAVFIPILLMGGIVGRLFREFAVMLSVAIVVSLVVSLTTTPMMCARLLSHAARAAPRPATASASASSTGCCAATTEPVAGCCAISACALIVTAGHHRAQRLSLHRSCPRDSSRSRTPAADRRRSRPIQDTSFQAMQKRHGEFVASSERPGRRPTSSPSPAAAGGGGALEHGADVRVAEAARASARPRPTRSSRAPRQGCRPGPGATLFLQAVQDIRVGGRQQCRSTSTPCRATTSPS